MGFLAAMLTVYLVAGEVMAVLQCIGYACSISDAMLGITFLAWGNSIGGERRVKNVSCIALEDSMHNKVTKGRQQDRIFLD